MRVPYSLFYPLLYLLRTPFNNFPDLIFGLTLRRCPFYFLKNFTKILKKTNFIEVLQGYSVALFIASTINSGPRRRSSGFLQALFTNMLMVLPIHLLVLFATVPLNPTLPTYRQVPRSFNPTGRNAAGQTLLLHAPHPRNHRGIHALNLLHQPFRRTTYRPD